ncbi:S41 family peptidase [Hymenobacter wooponensis]|uniref:Tail specific protease domain-containing protein n=1 Tax=Hymenobacter wooponensis TaxID=1525360 RepID=A0A4Z0MCR8_9BACT|nr:S41 family peptidase [Hymenobacter wooponensis]TGD77128.1 hypothetical protein EU557_24140 [Hymenobacter wooponensis]
MLQSLLFLLPALATAAPDTLTPRETRNLTALGQAAGAIKYFYPNRHTAQVSWETILVRSIPAVRRAPTDATLAVTLDSLFRTLAPAAHITAGPAVPSQTGLAQAGTGPFYYWEHQGLALDKKGLPVVRAMFQLGGLSYSSTIRAAEGPEADKLFQGQQHYTVRLLDSLSLTFPLLLPRAQYQQRLPYQPGRSVPRLSAATSAQRLTTVLLSWNILQHFYPYRAVLDSARWQQALPLALQHAARATTEAELLTACRTMLAKLPDRHVAISPKTRTGLHVISPPWALQLRLIEEQVVVQQVPPNLAPQLLPGAVLTHVNSQPVAALLGQLQGTIPATSSAVARQLATEALLTYVSAGASSARFTFRDAQEHEQTYTLAFRKLRGSMYHQPPVVREVAPGIYFLDAARLRYPDFLRALPQLQAARGVIIDLRQRPSYDLLRVLPHFSAHPLLPDSTATPVLRQPNFTQATFLGSASRPIVAQPPLLTARKVFLTGPHTYSYGETVAELVRRHQLGVLLGQTTGGTNGEMNFAAIGRVYQLSWTGRRIVGRGQPYQGTGLAPDIAVQPSLSHIVQGQDAELLRAVEWLQQTP